MSTMAPDAATFSSIIANQEFSRVADIFAQLATRPPQSLLIEGGSEETRFASALYWAMTANCQNQHNGRPCCQCPVCRQILALEYMDLLLLDGTISNKADTENPGVARSLKMDNTRELKSIIGVMPYGVNKRVVILSGLSKTREEALNSLLKILEEPLEHTLFALLAPQRQQILPTLVSRSFCLTLPWTTSEDDKKPELLENELAEFLRSGRGFLGEAAKKGFMDIRSGSRLVSACQKSLARGLGGKQPRNSLEKSFAAAGGEPLIAMKIGRWLEEAQNMIQAGVSPGLVLQALACRLFTTFSGKKLQ